MVSALFDKYASQYDHTRRMLIPCFDRFYWAAIEELSYPIHKELCVLDLGAGTGLLSAFLLARFQKARVVMIDSSEEMLRIAKNRFTAFEHQVEFLLDDYRYRLPPGPFDAVVSALSIHHLDEDEKKALITEIFRKLNPGGIFVNADQVLGESAEQEQDFRNSWLMQVRSSGISSMDLEAALERMKADKMSKLSWQLTCLREVGFEQVRCAFQELSFVVYSGHKTS